MPIALLAVGLFIPASDARALVTAGAAVLDTRPAGIFKAGHLPGAVPIDWQDFRDGHGRTGRLSDDDRRLSARLGALGVDDARPVVVYGAGRSGFGEEGRIAWMLAYLGHRDVHILDGGLAEWSGAIETGKPRPPRAGRFTPRRVAGLRADLAAVERARTDGATVILDVRTRAEWEGATPYSESRGGHIPGARHLDWTTLLDGAGRLLLAPALRERFGRAGIGAHTRVIVYCTGGVRSAFAWAALRQLGQPDVLNFDASFWEWSRRSELPVASRD
jgi:thiosulfate/3-mercaptopyruvate sulfurtransferase